MNRVLSLAKKHGVQKNSDLVLQLYQSYAVSLGMFGSHIWATPFLHTNRVWDSDEQQRHLHFLRHLLHVRSSTDRWALLHESGQYPFQFYWWRAALKFWNCSVASKNPLLRAVIRSDARLAVGPHPSRQCWSSEFLSALKSLPLGNGSQIDFTESIRTLQTLPVAAILDKVTSSFSSHWLPFGDIEDFRTPVLPHRKAATFFHAFKRSPDFPPSLPAYFRCPDLSQGDVQNLARFRLGSHFLAVETQRYSAVPWQARLCSRCSLQ